MSSLEYNGKVLAAESIDLIKYVHANFEGPLLFPTDPIKKESGEELLKYVDFYQRCI